jgi:hypothetical protein
MLRTGDKGDAVRAVQEILAFLGYRGLRKSGAGFEAVPLVADGDFGSITESAVLQFQTDNSLYADGVVGETTLAALRTTFASRHNELAAPGPVSAPAAATVPAFSATGLLPWERCEADKWGEGYASGWLRADAAAAYREVLAELRRHGGVLTSSGMRRDLTASVGPNRSATSMHYTGRAIDLFIYSGMQDPSGDAYVAERLGDRRYRVWARCWADRVAKKADLPPKVEVKNIATAKKRTSGVNVTDHFVDLTTLFAAHGFRPIRARPGFEQGGDYLGAEWWHFQWEVGLVPGSSTFGSDLLRAYPRATLEPTPPWSFRDRVWQVNWF